MKTHTPFRYVVLLLVLMSAINAFADENKVHSHKVQNSIHEVNRVDDEVIEPKFRRSQNTVSDSTKASELETITVKANRISAKPVQDFREFEKSNATDLKDVLADEVAVQFGGGNGLSQHITLRGMGADQIDYVVDNASTDATSIFHHQGRFMLDPALVKIVKIEKGTGSASSGIGATSGRIVAETVNATDLLREDQNAGFRVRGGVGSNSGHYYGIAAYGRTPDKFFDGIVMGNWTHEKDYKGGKGYVSADGTDKIKNSGLGNRSFLAKVNIHPNEDMTIGLKHSREENYGERNLREEFYFATANDNPYYKHRIQDNTNLYFKAKDAGIFSNIDANIFHIANKHKLKSANPTTPQTETIGSNLNLASKIGDNHTLKYGINYRTEESKQDSSSAIKQDKDDYKAYIEGLWGLGANQQFTLTTGLSYDYFKMKSAGNVTPSVSDGKVSPSVGLIWDATDNLSFALTHNYATRSPRFYEAQLAGNPISLDPDLKAERSRNTEANVKWQWNGLSLDASYFYQKIKDLTNYGGGRGQPVSIYSQGSLKNSGYEVNLGYKWRGLKSRIGVAYSKPEMNGTTLDVVQQAIPIGRQWTTSLSYHFEKPHLEIGWRGRFAEKSSYLPESSGRGGGDPVKRVGYGVHDFFANWQPTGKDDLNINLSIDNAFNKNYRSHSQRAGATAMPEAGRDIRLGLAYRW